jgi:NADH dehydrogenase
MRVAIIGGTGFVGSYIADELIEHGHDVSMLFRPGSEHKVRHSALIRLVTGSINSSESINDLLSGCEAVIYCVGILRESRRQGITFASTQFDGIATAVEAAEENGVSRFLLMSANGVKIPGTRYQETKKRAEDLLIASSLKATIFRPSVIFGNPRGRMEFATQLFKDMVDKPVPAVGFFSGLNTQSGAVRLSPVHVEDVAKAFVGSLTEPSTVGEIYSLGGPETLTWTEIIRRIAAATGREKRILPMPIMLMKFAAALFDWLPFFPVTRGQLTMLAEGNTADPAILESLIGSAPRAFKPEHLGYLND